MKNLKLLLFVIILLSCGTHNNSLTDKTKNVIQASVEKEKNLLDTILINNYRKEPNHDERVIDYCIGEINITDDKKSLKFIEFITQNEKYFVPIYFYAFNQICQKSDGSLSEVLGKYCLKVIVNHPNEVFRHFETNNKDLKLYANMLGYEFYFCIQGTSDLEMNFEQFKEYLINELNLNDKTTLDIYNQFCTETENTIKKMN